MKTIVTVINKQHKRFQQMIADGKRTPPPPHEMVITLNHHRPSCQHEYRVKKNLRTCWNSKIKLECCFSSNSHIFAINLQERAQQRRGSIISIVGAVCVLRCTIDASWSLHHDDQPYRDWPQEREIDDGDNYFLELHSHLMHRYNHSCHHYFERCSAWKTPFLLSYRCWYVACFASYAAAKETCVCWMANDDRLCSSASHR